MTPELLQNYLRSEYRVFDGERTIVLNLDTTSPELKELYARHNAITAVFMTAWNPHSETTDPDRNEINMVALLHDLTGYTLYNGEGADPTGEWPPERNVLALDVSMDKAVSLGQRYRQNAVIFANEDAIPRLILCESDK